MDVQIYDFNDELLVVPWFQLLQWRGAIRLEMQGMKNSRGSVTAHVRRKLSAPARYPRQAIYEHLDTSIIDISAQLDGTAEMNLEPAVEET